MAFPIEMTSNDHLKVPLSMARHPRAAAKPRVHTATTTGAVHGGLGGAFDQQQAAPHEGWMDQKMMNFRKETMVDDALIMFNTQIITIQYNL
jgi:hypothetical protein